MSVQDENSIYPKNRWVILFSIMLCPFLSQMNIGLMSVGLPGIASHFGVPTSTASWVATIFPVIISGVVIFFGKLGDEAGHNRIFKYGLMLFSVGTLLCGLSANFTQLIIFRIIQAFGAGAFMGNEHGALTKLFPQSELGKAFGFNSAAVALGTLCGSLLGGILVANSSWNFLFFCQLPVCAALIIFQLIILPNEASPTKVKMDIPGAFLLFIAISGVFVALQQLHSLGIGHPLILSGFCAGIVCLSLFILRQKKTSAPLLPLEIFSDRWFVISLVCLSILNFLVSGTNLIMPFYFQRALGFGAALSGALLALPHLVNALVAPMSGRISLRAGREKTAFIGMTLTFVGMLLLSASSLSFFAVSVVGMLVYASGNGLFQSPNNAIVMSSIDRRHIGIASSMNAFSRNLGNSLGTVAANTVLYTAMSAKVGVKVSTYIAARPDVFIFGMRWVFIVAALVALTGTVLTLLRLKSKKGDY